VPGWDFLRALESEIVEIVGLAASEEILPDAPVVLVGRFANGALFQTTLLPQQPDDSWRCAVRTGGNLMELRFPQGWPGPAHLSWLDEAGVSHEESWESWDRWPALVAAFESALAGKTPLHVELKAPAPLCDPADTTEAAYVAAVVDEIERTHMIDQVVLTSFSPTLLALARSMSPDIAVELAVSALQFLTAEEVEAATGLPATQIAKDDFGLVWAEIGPVYRLPGYSSPAQAIGVAAAIGASAISLDILFLGGAEQAQPGSGAAIVGGARSIGLAVSAYTATSDPEWFFLDSLGLDSITTDDLSSHLQYQH
jgi:glycerophosphoryl diester phosphodiesterase